MESRKVHFLHSRVIEGHKGAVTQVAFGPDSDTIVSSSDDGKVLVWNWKTGTITSSCMRHPASVRTFDFNYDRPDLVVCGRNDGFVTVWNTAASIRMDEISPDPIWNQKDPYLGIIAKDTNHCGPILCVKFSLDKQLLATCSSDNTCKLWRINSYQKDLLNVKAQLKQTDTVNRVLEGYIDVLDEELDSQLQFERSQVVMLGEVPISPGYHADLKFTFQHEAPVLSCAFTINSEYYPLT
jgi:WD40 repeat protein